MDFPKIRSILLLGLAVAAFNGCSSSNNNGESSDLAAQQLSSPSSFTLSGTGTGSVGSTDYLYATASGTIDTSGNTMVAVFSDPLLPLSLFSTSAYSDQMTTGSCATLSPLLSAVSGSSGNEITTQISATGCTDQSMITLLLDTTQVEDNNGDEGEDVISTEFTVDLAPKVTTVVTGNSAADGTGTTESTAGDYVLATDQSIVTTFSKSLTGGAFNATLSGCAATLSSATLVAGSNGTTLFWTLGNLGFVVPGNTCTLNVSEITDLAGNPDDQSDPNASMTFTFH